MADNVCVCLYVCVCVLECHTLVSDTTVCDTQVGEGMPPYRKCHDAGVEYFPHSSLKTATFVDERGALNHNKEEIKSGGYNYGVKTTRLHVCHVWNT